MIRQYQGTRAIILYDTDKLNNFLTILPQNWYGPQNWYDSKTEVKMKKRAEKKELFP